jgi:hypothetical protein
MEKTEALKILDEVMASIDTHVDMVAPDDAKMSDWSYDILQVYNAIHDGELEDDDEC